MKKHIIVIEDDRDILDIIEMVLKEEGYEITSLDRVPSLEKIVNLNPSLILLDNRLADGYGNTLCLAIKSYSLTRQVPVIMVSPSTSLPVIAEKCHADDYLSKPFDLYELIGLVKKYSEKTLVQV
jgi:DNA-binding response OmpR family regulator